MNARSAAVLVTGVGLTLAACGTSDPAATTPPDTSPPASADAAPATGAPADAPPLETEVANDASPATETAATETPTNPPATDTPATDDAPAEPPPTDASPAEPEAAPVGGRTFATAVEPAAQFDGNPFPDLVVADVGRGAEANIANILPSDRPVLLWTWAPH